MLPSGCGWGNCKFKSPKSQVCWSVGREYVQFTVLQTFRPETFRPETLRLETLRLLEQVVETDIELHTPVLFLQCLADVSRDYKVLVHGNLKAKAGSNVWCILILSQVVADQFTRVVCLQVT